jgi:fluoride ion exporter CrcB/FEX
VSVARVAGAAFFGGIAGSAARQLVTFAVVGAGGSDVAARMIVNVVGGFLAGTYLARREADPARLNPFEPLVAAGFLGGFTTVAGYALDAAQACELSDWNGLAAVLAVDGLVGLLAAALGHRLTSAGPPTTRRSPR